MIDRMTKYSFVLLSGGEAEFLRQIEALGLVDITRSSKPVDDRSSALVSKIAELKSAIEKLVKTDFSKDPDYEKFSNASLSEIENPLETFKQDEADLSRSCQRRAASLKTERLGAASTRESWRPSAKEGLKSAFTRLPLSISTQLGRSNSRSRSSRGARMRSGS